jgi:hypothetical protein
VPTTSDVGQCHSTSELAIQNHLSVTNLHCIDGFSIQELYHALGLSVALGKHQLGHSQLTGTAMGVDHDCLRQECIQELMALQIAQNHVTKGEAKIQQLRTRNQETTTESMGYHDRITSFRNKLNRASAHADVLQTVAVVLGAALRLQRHLQLGFISD